MLLSRRPVSTPSPITAVWSPQTPRFERALITRASFFCFLLQPDGLVFFLLVIPIILYMTGQARAAAKQCPKSLHRLCLRI